MSRIRSWFDPSFRFKAAVGAAVGATTAAAGAGMCFDVHSEEKFGEERESY